VSITSSIRRQSYLQDVVVAGLRALGFEEQAARSVALSYEMVRSARCSAELGSRSPKRTQPPIHEVSGPRASE